MKMVKIRLEIPGNMKREMAKYPKTNWSDVVTEAFWKKIKNDKT